MSGSPPDKTDSAQGSADTDEKTPIPPSAVPSDPSAPAANNQQIPADTPKRGTKTSNSKSGARESSPGRGGGVRAPQFAPRDLTDGKEPGQWQSSYTDSGAKWGIRLEACYLAILFIIIPILLLCVWLRCLDSLFGAYPVWHQQSQTITNYMLAWIGGTLGGTLFSTKWLYHSVAKRLWHVDRRLWRFFTPHLSGTLAFSVFVIVTSGLLPIVEKKAMESEATAFSLGFIVGYFSDSATAKLTEVAETLFGSNRK